MDEVAFFDRALEAANGGGGHFLRGERGQHAGRLDVIEHLRRDGVETQHIDGHAVLRARFGIQTDGFGDVAVAVDVVDVGNGVQRIAEVQHVDLAAADLRLLGRAVRHVHVVVPATGDVALHTREDAEGVAIRHVATCADFAQAAVERVVTQAVSVGIGQQVVNAVLDQRIAQDLVADAMLGLDHAAAGRQDVGRRKRERLEAGAGAGLRIGALDVGTVVVGQRHFALGGEQEALRRDGDGAEVLAIEARGRTRGAAVGAGGDDVSGLIEGANAATKVEATLGAKPDRKGARKLYRSAGSPLKLYSPMLSISLPGRFLPATTPWRDQPKCAINVALPSPEFEPKVMLNLSFLSSP